MDIVTRIFSWLLGATLVVYLMFRALRRSDEPKALAKRWLWSALLVLGLWYFLKRIGFTGTGNLAANYAIAMVIGGVLAAFGVILGVLWAPSYAAILSRPLTNLFDGGMEEIEPSASYDVAEARRKRGLYTEAIQEIHRQLESFPGDFRGMMLLAEIEAEDLKNLGAAECTLEELMALSEEEPGNIIVALNRLSDWRLKLGGDIEGARQALEQIRHRFPDTEPAFLAEQRLAHLATPELLEERKSPHRVRVEARAKPLTAEELSSREEEKTSKVVAELVRHLEQHPNDVEARERLARAYVEVYGRLDLARGEWEHLIAMPHASPRQVGQWLNGLADLEARHAGDLDAARAALERLIERYPKSAVAEGARNRIPLLRLELRGKAKSQTIPSGSAYKES